MGWWKRHPSFSGKMKNISKLSFAFFAGLCALCSCSQAASQEEGFSIKLSLSELTPSSVTVGAAPSDSETEYCLYVTPKADYRASRIPREAEYAKGEHTLAVSSLDAGVDYFAVAVVEMTGYSAILEFNTASAIGNLDPAGHPEDFNVTSIPTKQAKSAKRGVAGNLQTATDPGLLGKGVSWDYDWSHNYPSNADALYAGGLTFFPMVWNAGLNKDNISRLKANYPQSGWILGYNEPNLTDQANMVPSVAAKTWPELRAFSKTVGMKLVSPALNYGTLSGYSDPVVWLDEFIACDGIGSDAFDAIALHCYMPNVNGMRTMIRRFDKYGKPIYMTEFCHANGSITNSESDQISFMSEVLNMLETDSNVGGYSWFMARAGGSWGAISLLNSDTQKPALTPLGKLYVNFSSFDKNCWYTRHEPIPAAHYVAHNLSESTTGWGDVFKVRPCTDVYGDLMILCNTAESWAEYQIEVDKDGTYALAVRYIAELLGGKMVLTIDGGDQQIVDFEQTSSWKCKWIEDITLSKGRHTIRLKLRSGRVDINWLYLD